MASYPDGQEPLALTDFQVQTDAALQRAMVEDVIGRRLEITVWSNGALVDVIAVPRELADT